MKQKVIIVIGALVVVAALAAYLLFSKLDFFVESAVEKYGSQATGTSVDLDSVSIKLADGAGTLSGLSVANPKGFNAKRALLLGAIDVTIDAASVRGDGPVLIKTVTITRPKITYEVGSTGGNNLDALKRHAATALQTGEADKGAKPARKFIIEDLYIKGGEISITHPLLQGRALSENLPTIHLRDVGKSSGGATPGEIAAKVASSIESAATRVSAPDIQKQIGSLKDLTTSGASKVTDKVKGLFGR
ncbi:MAG: hypothetical protein ACAH83_07685 [Alphaproteobacteria bacterium]